MEEYRAMTAMEASHGILEKPVTRLSHPVVQLVVHEEGNEKIVWKRGKEGQKIRALRLGHATSQLTAWMKLNMHD